MKIWGLYTSVIILTMESGENFWICYAICDKRFFNSVCKVSKGSVPEWASSKRTKARNVFVGHPILNISDQQKHAVYYIAWNKIVGKLQQAFWIRFLLSWYWSQILSVTYLFTAFIVTPIPRVPQQNNHCWFGGVICINLLLCWLICYHKVIQVRFIITTVLGLNEIFDFYN